MEMSFLELGLKIKDVVSEKRDGSTVMFMQGIGKMTLEKEKGNLFGLMGTVTKENGKTIKRMVKELISAQIMTRTRDNG